MQTRVRPFSNVVHVVFAYAAVAGLWIVASDVSLAWLVQDPALRTVADSLKGWAFVIVTSALLYGLLRRFARHQLEGLAREREAVEAQTRTLMLLQALLQSSSDAIFAKDCEGRYLLLNAAAARVAGVDGAQIDGLDDGVLFPPKYAAKMRAQDERVLLQDHPQTFEEALDTADGRRTFLTIKGPLQDAQKRVIGTFGISRDITERLRTERQLRESEHRYRILFEANPHPMWVFDVQTLRFIAVNEAAVAQYGYTREEFLTMTIHDICPPAERERLRTVLAQAEEEAQSTVAHMGTWIHRRRDGGLVEVEISTSELVLDGRQAELVLAHDVTQRRDLERQRRATLAEAVTVRDLLRDVLARVDDGFVALDGTWHCTYLNDQAARMFGRERPEDLLGRYIWAELGGKAGPLQRACEQSMSMQQPVMFEDHFRLEGRWLENRIYPSMSGLSVYVSDITSRKQTELRLREAEAYQRSLFDQLADGVLVLDSERRILDANPQALAMLGYSRAELLGSPVQALLVDQERYRLEWPVQGELDDRTHSAEWECISKAGSRFAAEVSARRLDGLRCLTVWRDITQRRHSEKALVQYQFELSELTQRLMEQEKLTTRRLAQALHDRLGQTLTAIRFALEALSERLAPVAAARVQQVQSLVDEAVREVRQALVDLRPPLLDERGLVAALDNEVRKRQSGDGLVDVLLEVDPAMTAQRWPPDVEYAAFMVAREALGNALQHADPALVRVRLAGCDGSLFLAVIDDGCGVTPERASGRPGHLGMVGMRERALAIGATFKVTSPDGDGTVVILHWKEPS